MWHLVLYFNRNKEGNGCESLNKVFNKWAGKEGLGDDALRNAVDEMERGLIDADLGGHVMKKRVGWWSRQARWRSYTAGV